MKSKDKLLIKSGLSLTKIHRLNLAASSDHVQSRRTIKQICLIHSQDFVKAEIRQRYLNC